MEQRKDQLKNRTGEELLSMVEEAKGHTQKDFQEFFGTDYSYTTLTDELTRRGYKNGWHLPGGPAPEESNLKTVVVSADEPKVRFNLSMTSSVKDRYARFLEGKSMGFRHTTAALELYMDAVEAGEVKVVVE